MATKKKNASHRKSKKAMKSARTKLARTAGYGKQAARKSGKKAKYRGDSRKYGPTRLPKYQNKKKKKATARTKPNPGTKLRASISQMKPNTWYPSTLAGAKVKVKRKGMGLEIKPIGKRKRSR